jgi:ribonucleoside-diphosphate reductase beta chain
MTITHNAFTTTSSRGLRQDILPMRLYHKARKLGVWDPQSIDFSQNILDWQRLKDTEKETLLQLTTLFQAGEECVTLDLLPLVMVIAQEGRLEEEMYLYYLPKEEALLHNHALWARNSCSIVRRSFATDPPGFALARFL